jgi:hypothetical protein
LAVFFKKSPANWQLKEILPASRQSRKGRKGLSKGCSPYPNLIPFPKLRQLQEMLENLFLFPGHSDYNQSVSSAFSRGNLA